MTEAEIQTAVIAHWRACGLPNTLLAAIPNARAFGQAGLTKGLPDLIMWAPGLPMATMELKTDKGRLRPEQNELRLLAIKVGARHAITYGRDEPIRVLEAWGLVRPAVSASPARGVE